MVFFGAVEKSLFPSFHSLFNKALLAIIDKYGVPVKQWAWLCQAFLEVSMNKIVLWISVCANY